VEVAAVEEVEVPLLSSYIHESLNYVILARYVRTIRQLLTTRRFVDCLLLLNDGVRMKVKLIPLSVNRMRRWCRVCAPTMLQRM
jgi:hypothetical protein